MYGQRSSVEYRLRRMEGLNIISNPNYFKIDNNEVYKISCDNAGNWLIFTKNGIYIANYMTRLSNSGKSTSLLAELLDPLLNKLISRIENIFKRDIDFIKESACYIVRIDINDIVSMDLGYGLFNKKRQIFLPRNSLRINNNHSADFCRLS